jgi:hypothetical protein
MMTSYLSLRTTEGYPSLGPSLPTLPPAPSVPHTFPPSWEPVLRPPVARTTGWGAGRMYQEGLVRLQPRTPERPGLGPMLEQAQDDPR